MFQVSVNMTEYKCYSCDAESTDSAVLLAHTITNHPDRAPLKEVLGGQYNYREGGGKCCGKALKAAGGVEVVDVIRIRAPKKWVAGARIQAQSAGGRYMGLDRALIST